VLLLGLLVVAALIAGCALLKPNHKQPVRALPVEATSTSQRAIPPPATPSAAVVPNARATASAPATTPAAKTGARLALIVDDCGQWIDTEREFAELPFPLTLSVLPDVRYTGTIASEAAADGKGVMLHLPMDTISGMNPGPGKVTTLMSDAAIAQQVDADLAQIPQAQGVNNHEGSKGSADPRLMRDVSAVLARHGNLFFIDSKTAPNSVAQHEAMAAGLPTASRDVFLDNVDSVPAVEAQLRVAASLALRNGSAIAIGHPRVATYEAVRALAPVLEREGITFVFARDLVAR
jgi:polysaccharide deacetylase 2 family uncharacterized protein YibQ